jgi:hypothetical protein
MVAPTYYGGEVVRPETAMETTRRAVLNVGEAAATAADMTQDGIEAATRTAAAVARRAVGDVVQSASRRLQRTEQFDLGSPERASPQDRDFETPPSNGDGEVAPEPRPRTRRRRSQQPENIPAEVAAEPKAKPRARPKPKVEPRSEPSQAASSSQEPSAEPAPSAPSAPSAEPVPSAQPTEIQVVQPTASTALAEVTRAEASGPREADTTEDTGRINAWFRMQNPTFYNTKTYDPLADLNAANKLDRYMKKNTFIF